MTALARLISRGQSGLDAYEVSVEVHLAGGLPGFAITGLPTAAVRESKDRVRAALQTCGFGVPAQRITVHLGPADVPKGGGRFDLAIALGVIQAARKAAWPADEWEFLGELALSGELRPVNGAVPAALASRASGRRLVVPRENADEVAFVDGARVYAAGHLLEVHAALEGKAELARIVPRGLEPDPPPTRDLSDVRGQALPKRALTVAAAGGHNLLMIGPPGSGKSMLAERMRGLLPALDEAEMLCVASIASVAGDRYAWKRGTAPPFRAPHHSTSMLALVGGGARPRPGEVSLAHRGVLFLDELPEFSRAALEALREPIETGLVQISRLHERVVYPAEFQLLAAMNPCPCGRYGDGTDRCSCSATRIAAYRAKVSGPLLDRFDLHVEVPQVGFEALAATGAACESETLRRAVAAARGRQLTARGALNARLEDAALWRDGLTGEANRLLKRAAEQWNLSARSTVRILRVARTIADLEACSSLEPHHLAEALKLRYLDRSA